MATTDTRVRCITCGAERRVGFGYCLAHGWPKCCGYTMRMVETTADIGATVKTAIRPATEKVVRLD